MVMALPEWSEVIAAKDAEIAKKDRELDVAAEMIFEVKEENRRLREELAEARRMADVERGRS
jgi:hypothetical protein